jgi:hypothetical protein
LPEFVHNDLQVVTPDARAERPTFAVFANVGIFRPSFSTIPLVVEFNPPPFETH